MFKYNLLLRLKKYGPALESGTLIHEKIKVVLKLLPLFLTFTKSCILNLYLECVHLGDSSLMSM